MFDPNMNCSDEKISDQTMLQWCTSDAARSRSEGEVVVLGSRVVGLGVQEQWLCVEPHAWIW